VSSSVAVSGPHICGPDAFGDVIFTTDTAPNMVTSSIVRPLDSTFSRRRAVRCLEVDSSVPESSIVYDGDSPDPNALLVVSFISPESSDSAVATRSISAA